jgi:hypothetical protein
MDWCTQEEFVQIVRNHVRKKNADLRGYIYQHANRWTPNREQTMISHGQMLDETLTIYDFEKVSNPSLKNKIFKEIDEATMISKRQEIRIPYWDRESISMIARRCWNAMKAIRDEADICKTLREHLSQYNEQQELILKHLILGILEILGMEGLSKKAKVDKSYKLLIIERLRENGNTKTATRIHKYWCKAVPLRYGTFILSQELGWNTDKLTRTWLAHEIDFEGLRKWVVYEIIHSPGAQIPK